MTRINVVHPSELCDQHLLAEYRELPRVFKLARPTTHDETPRVYTLGKGHVKFFYNKLWFLERRFLSIVEECQRRGFNIKYTELPTTGKGILYNDWLPTDIDIALNRARIKDRMPPKPRFTKGENNATKA